MDVIHHNGDIGNHDCDLLDIHVVAGYVGTSRTALANNRGTVTDSLHCVHDQLLF